MEQKKKKTMFTFYDQFKDVSSSYLDLIIEDPFKDLKEKYKEGCKDCSDKKYVFGEGKIDPVYCFIGHWTSKYEMENGIFSTIPNLKIHNLISYMGKDAYYTNVFGCSCNHPKCLDRLKEEMKVVNPEIIICLGADVFNSITQDSKPMKDLRLKPHTIELDKFYSVYVTHSLRELSYKRDEIFPLLKEELDFIRGQ